MVQQIKSQHTSKKCRVVLSGSIQFPHWDWVWANSFLPKLVNTKVASLQLFGEFLLHFFSEFGSELLLCLVGGIVVGVEIVTLNGRSHFFFSMILWKVISLRVYIVVSGVAVVRLTITKISQDKT